MQLVAEKTAVIEVERTRDAALIESVIRHPRIYPHVTDDFAPAPELFSAREAAHHPHVYFLTVRADGELLGLFMLHQHNAVLYEVHTCLLPSAWGARARGAAQAAARWMFENTACRKIVTLVPQGNALALRFARRAGMRAEGIITASYMKGGRLVDQTLLGMQKEAVCR